MIEKPILNLLLAGVQPALPRQRFYNNIAARLVSDIEDTTLTFSIDKLAGDWPAMLDEGQWFHLTASNEQGEYEIMRVAAISGDVVTVVRGQEGTPAQAWDAPSSIVSGRLTGGTLNRGPRIDEITQFSPVQSFVGGALFRNEARHTAPLTFGVSETEVAILYPTTTGLDIEAGTALNIDAPELRLNGIGYPINPELVEGQHLFVQDAQIVGRALEWYLGAYSTPPMTLPGGAPLMPGMSYYDLTTLRPKVWTGTSWVDFGVPQAGAIMTLVYEVGATPQGTFSTSDSDLFGNSFVMDTADPEPLHVYHNGLLLEPDDETLTKDYTIDTSTSSVQLLGASATNGDVVQIDIFQPRSKLAPGSVEAVAIVEIDPDGTTDTFELRRADTNDLITTANSAQVALFVDGVQQQPGVAFALDGFGNVTLAEIPHHTAIIWGVYYYTTGGGGGGGGSLAWADITGKPATFPSSWSTISGRPATVTVGTGAADVGKLALLGADGKFDVSLLPSIPVGGSVAWSSITGKPTTFPSDWSILTGIPATFAPSAHAHAWGDITSKPATFPPDAHVHAYSSLTGIPATFAPSAHTQLKATITDLPAMVNESGGPPDVGKLALLDADGLLDVSFFPPDIGGGGGVGDFDVLDGNGEGGGGGDLIIDGNDE